MFKDIIMDKDIFSIAANCSGKFPPRIIIRDKGIMERYLGIVTPGIFLKFSNPAFVSQAGQSFPVGRVRSAAPSILSEVEFLCLPVRTFIHVLYIESLASAPVTVLCRC